MSSTGETAEMCNRLCDVAADRFKRSAVGRFNGSEIRDTISVLRRKGLIGWKSPEEVRRDCERMDREVPDCKKSNGVNGDASRAGAAKRLRMNDAARWEKIEVVHDWMRKGKPTPLACELAGVNYQTYVRWRERYEITVPAMTGRLDVNMGRGEK